MFPSSHMILMQGSLKSADRLAFNANSMVTRFNQCLSATLQQRVYAIFCLNELVNESSWLHWSVGIL